MPTIIVETFDAPIGVETFAAPIEVVVEPIGIPGAAGDIAAANAYADTQIAAEQAARTAGDAASLAAVDALAGDVATRTTVAAVGALIAAAVGTVTQAYSAVLTGLTALNPTVFGKSLLELASAATLRTSIALPIASNVGRLARYTDTAGAQAQTAGLYEDASGKVGLGTTSPNAPLDIHVAATFEGIRVTRNNATGQYLSLNEGGHTAHQIQGFGGKPVFITNQDTTADGAGNQGIAFEFDVNGATNGATGTRALIIRNSGNIGAGVVSPVCKLDVDGAIRCKSYTVATVPSAALGAGQIVHVSNESGGAVLAFSDGTSWRRVTDRAVIS